MTKLERRFGIVLQTEDKSAGVVYDKLPTPRKRKLQRIMAIGYLTASLKKYKGRFQR